MSKIAVVGRGNVGFHLVKAFNEAGLSVDSIDSRTLEGLDSSYGLILIAVKDEAIRSVASEMAEILPDYSGIVAHTAGSVPLAALTPFFKRTGVFYPLQTFSKTVDIQDYREIPVFIEGSDSSVKEILRETGRHVFDKVSILDSGTREKLHLASVFVCNYVNALYGIGEEILRDAGLKFDVLLPLITQTASKVGKHTPDDSQTGPARRGDLNVLERHVELLKNNDRLKEIYQLLSQFIYRKYNE